MDWVWFMAANLGNWIICEGVAKVTFKDKGFEAVLYFDEKDKNPYLSINGTVNDNSTVEVTCCPFDKDVPSYKMFGIYDKSDFQDEVAYTISLMDGGTLVGIAKREINT